MKELFMKRSLLLVCFAFMLTAPAYADSSSTTAYQNGMAIMHREMDIVYSGQTDTDFVRGMIPHHQGAVDMVDVVLEYGKDPFVNRLALFIKVSQEAEIAWMNRWMERRAVPEPKCKACEPKDIASINEYKEAMIVMHRDMNIAYSGDADVDFVCGMIPHHQGAIDMAFTQLRFGNDPEVAKLTRGIIRSQKSDIARMEGWLEDKKIACALSTASMQHHH